MDLLLKLDARVQPGIPTADFTKLLRKCTQCEMVMTRRVARQHRCLIPVIIDLVGDEDEAFCSAVVDLTSLTRVWTPTTPDSLDRNIFHSGQDIMTCDIWILRMTQYLLQFR